MHEFWVCKAVRFYNPTWLTLQRIETICFFLVYVQLQELTILNFTDYYLTFLWSAADKCVILIGLSFIFKLWQTIYFTLHIVNHSLYKSGMKSEE